MNRTACIIGGGVIGACSAYYLARAGWRVTILDRAGFGSACSAGNCGYVCPSHVLPLATPGAIWSTLKTLFNRNSALKVRPGFFLRNMGWFLRFAKRCNTADMMSAAVGIQALLNSSRELFDELLRKENIRCEWDTHGLLFVFQTKKAFDHYAETDQLLRDKFEMKTWRFPADDLLGMEPALKPGSVSGAYLYKCDAQLRPDVFMKEMRRVLESLGVRIVEHAAMTDLEVDRYKVQAVKTVDDKFYANAFVFATGAWTPLLQNHLGVRVPIIPGKGYSFTVDRPTVCPKYPMIFEEHRVAVSPFETGMRIGSTMEFAGYDESLNLRRLQLLRDGAAFYLKDPGEGSRLQNEWWGWRPMIPDGKPVIDFSPKYRNVMIAAGHGMLGLSMATGTGKLVAELLAVEKPHVNPSHYSLKRFG